MNPQHDSGFRPAAWRRLGALVALAATMGFTCLPTLVVAQAAAEPDMPAAKTKPASKPAQKPVARKSRATPTDNVSDDLNRRESERVARMLQGAATPAAAPTAAVAPPAMAMPASVVTTVDTKPADGPPTVPAIPHRAPIVPAVLTPTVDVAPVGAPNVQPPPRIVEDAVLPHAAPAAPPPRQAQARPPVPIPAPAQPLSPGAGAPPPQVVGSVPTRPFAQSQVVPPQQPTLTLEVAKGTAIKLPGPASTVFVAAPDIADVQVKSPTMIYVFAKKAGDTVLYAVDDQDRVLLNTIVTVTSPISRMRASLDELHPGNAIQIANQGEAIILSGTVRSAAAAEDARRIALQHTTSNAKVINNIKVDAPNQVQLRVKVAEVNRGTLKRVGINWQNINNIAMFGLGPIVAGFATNTITAAGAGAIMPGSLRVQGQSNDGSLTALIDMLATQNQATILAEPNLIAMSGESASFLAGGEIPVIQPQTGGGLTSTITVAYKQVGISLNFTPTIIGERISLKVAPEVSQVTAEGQVLVAVSPTASIVIPAIQTRRVSTTVELGSGQSFAIAGLLNHTTQQDIQKVPWLADVPMLGSLFKSDAYQRQETELVIIVTPYFVEPVSTALRTPLTGRVPPTDADRLLYQRMNHPTPPQRLSVGREQQRYAGPGTAGATAGFKLD
jgi:pilus assembly protein CpaC